LGLVDLPKGAKLFARQGLAQLQALALPEVSALQRDLLLEQLASFTQQLERVEQELAKIAQTHPQMQLLMSIPGVGIRTAEAYLAYVDDIRRFRRVNQVGAYFGMVPCEDSSADTRRLGHITKDGPASVRWLVCEAAWQGVRRSPTLRAFHARIMKEDPDRRKIALVATGHYLLRVMAAMLRTGELWRESVRQEDLSPLPQTMKEPGPTPKSRPRRLLHGGARVASQQSPILRVEEPNVPQLPSGANLREPGEPSTTKPN
jgi:hypothetical protein